MSKQATLKKATERHYSDLGPKETAQHGGIVVEDTEVAGIKRARRLAPLEQWYKDEQIDNAQYAAGGQFEQDFHDAGLEFTCERQERVDGSRAMDMPIKMIRAKQNLKDIKDAVPEWEWFCLWHCVGEARNFLETARLARWTPSPTARLPRDDKTVKKYTFIALTSAARFYRVG